MEEMNLEDFTLWDLAILQMKIASEPGCVLAAEKSHTVELQQMYAAALRLEEYQLCEIFQREIKIRQEKMSAQINKCFIDDPGKIID
jgi:hypothetical protein